jgi:tRNA A-37 threonylcarbamoyl transferase component Bud32
MKGHARIMAPRAPTPMPGMTPTGRTLGRLPDEMLAEQVERLAVFSAVVAALWTFGLAMDIFIVPLLLGIRRVPTGSFLEAGAIILSIVMHVYFRRVHHTADTKKAVGLGFMIANAVGIGVLNTMAMAEAVPKGPEVSWTAILILVFSMISPAAPRTMLSASLVAATMDPLVSSLASLRGWPALPPMMAFLHFLPNYICAFVALVPWKVFQKLGHRLREAQDLGSYQLVELLGHGGMGEVWRAEHRMLARSAAVKLVRPEVLGAGNETDTRLVLRRFEREARATASLSSPHTIQIFDFGMTNDGNFYYVMELLSGRDLESLVRDYGPLPADRAIFLLRQISHSLADAHARGLVHRDIKPANIYACRMGLEYDFIKVLDFGLVKFKDRELGQRTTMMTLDHRTTGTPAYMAPEIILGEADVDSRADVYALGCVMYYLLTGLLVFEADSAIKMLMQHVQATPVPPSQRTELPIPQELDDLVLACLQKDPNLRPQHAQDLFRLAYSCRHCESWTPDASKAWWERHLPELTGPLTVSEPTEQAARAAIVLH